MNNQRKRSSFGWFRSTLTGHIVFCQLFYAIPMFLIFAYFAYADGYAITASKLLITLFGASVGGFLGACLFWYTVTVRILKKLEK